MEFENSTTELTEARSGEQAEVVASPEETPTAQTDAGQEGAVSLQNDDFRIVEVSEDSGEADGDENAPAPGDAGREREQQQVKTRQTREENAAYRNMRLRAQQEAETVAAAKTDAAIAGMAGLRNPYTHKPFSSMKELADYNETVIRAENEKKAKETGRSVEEITEDEQNRAFLTAMRKNAAQQAAERQQQQARSEWFRRDLADFMDTHPEVDVTALDNNPRFRKFAGSRYGREPLSQLYDDYVEIVGDASNAAVAKAASRSTRSTGSGSTGGVVLTPTQKAALDKWNADYPEMAMTAKEFLGR